ncbi:MAG: antibiotic biosynthesis monooxygenase [Bdellovibrionota bacterium]|nr:antibiotic biosynthesis monooxygenase [Bdellovibrionota bacterium]
MGTFHVVVRFQLESGELEKLKPIVKDFFESEVSKFPGFVSAKFHENEDKSVFLNYATWESQEAYSRFLDEVGMKSERAKKVLEFNPSADQLHHIQL